MYKLQQNDGSGRMRSAPMRLRSHSYLFLLASCTIALFWLGCGGEGETRATLLAPTGAEVRAALGGTSKQNPYGIVPGISFDGVTLPTCTAVDVEQILYALEIPDEASWLSFDSATRTLSATTVPADAYDAIEVTYSCSDASDATVRAEVTLTINDLDGGGVTDGHEFRYGSVPFLNNRTGWIWFSPNVTDAYLFSISSSGRVPTGIVLSNSSMDATDPDDDSEDFDGDACDNPEVGGCGNNDEEIEYGSNPFVAASTGTYANGVSYTTIAGGRPYGITSADFDEDGDIDLAVTNKSGDSMTVLIGDGDGNFSVHATYVTGETPEGIVAADFNNDGNLDLATVDFSDDRATLFLGDGSGAFAAGGVLTTGAGPYYVAAADFNGDGNVDLVSTNASGSSISILLGNGDGTFQAKIDHAVGFWLNEIAVADFDGDGAIDLAVANGYDVGWVKSDAVIILMGVGDGTFAVPVEYNIGGEIVYDLTVADFDGDGDIDIAATSSEDNFVAILHNDGGGVFSVDETTYDVGDLPAGMTAADVDGDGDIDLLVTNWNGDTMSVLFGDGAGAFSLSANYATPHNPFGITVADFDGDGDLDAAVASNGLGVDTISLFLNQ